ncbi:MAG: hypothetical protein JXA44_04100 [Methanospirillaceae archaeon]|nr:hypothetical protein [Methanospirillaceae archaeon]
MFTSKISCSYKKEIESGKTFIPAGFVVKSSNPHIKTGRHDTWEGAFEEFQIRFQDELASLFLGQCPEYTILGPFFSGKSMKCKESLGEYELKCEPEDLSITWTIDISRGENHTLSDYTPELGVSEEVI